MDEESSPASDFKIFSEIMVRGRGAANLSPGARKLRAMNLFLYNKYSSSQNYYYSKDISDILSKTRSRTAIAYSDIENSLNPVGYFKQFYARHEQPAKLKMSTEYFKYHEDVPRLFMIDLAPVIHNFYDKKRRINYIRITKMLKGNIDQKVKIHDSESLNVSECSVGLSLQKLLPDEL